MKINRLFSAIWIVLLMLQFSMGGTVAQSDSPSLFPEACLTEAEPIETGDLAFDGTLLMIGRYGIHGFKSEWETPRVLAFLDQGTRGREIRDLSLSPDLRFAAVAEGLSAHIEGTFTGFYEGVNAIRIYPLGESSATDIKIIPWDNTALGSGWGEGFPTIHWLSNSSFLFQNLSGLGVEPVIQEVDAITEETTTWNAEVPYSILDFPSSLSPDGTLYLSTHRIDEGQFRLAIFDTTTVQAIHVVETVEPYAGFVTSINMWAPNSQFFLLPVHTGNGTLDVRLFTRDGIYLATLATVPNEQWIDHRYTTLDWSADSRRVALWLGTDRYGEINQINQTAVRVFDIEERKLLSQCIQPTGGFASMSWSPDSRQIAIADDLFDFISIWDIEGGRWREIAPNDGYRSFAWRAD